MDFAVILTTAPFILRGTVVTVELVVLVLLLSAPLAVLVALGRDSRAAWLSIPLGVLSSTVRGLPPLLILFGVYFALPQLGLEIDPFPAAVAGMTLYVMFYFAEAVRAGLASVDRGQLIAARALALPPARTLLRIILPQAMPAALPSCIGYATEVVKSSALTASIAVAETMGNAYQLILTTNRPFEILLFVAAIYAVLDTILLLLQGVAERRWPQRARR
jgi:His/Glu/Gln/Arg/opine family amino acid ABC transporter permease subunit